MFYIITTIENIFTNL